jgi:hypothetical protein
MNILHSPLAPFAIRFKCFFLLVLGSFSNICSFALCDEGEVRKSVRLAIGKLDSVTSVSLKGEYSSDRYECESVRFEKLGKKFLFSGDVLPRSRDKGVEDAKKVLIRNNRLLGSDTPYWLLFDGQKVFEYAPQRLGFGSFKVTEPPESHYLVPFDPIYWSRLLSKVPVELVLATLDYRELDSGRHEFSKSFPSTSDSPVAYDRIVLIADESQGWNIVSAVFEGGAFADTRLETSWSESGERWYPATGKVFRKGIVSEQWSITSISFESSAVTTQFRFDESSLPVGIKITEGKPGTDQKVRFVGGDEGNRQYRLIMGLGSLDSPK